jgi:glyoxylase-like metal-dependent hydrolase (beta-lactamase superfamily II)
MRELGSFKLDLISDGLFEWDASTLARTDQTGHESDPAIHYKQLVKIGFNSLLIRGSGRTILIDPGSGDKPRQDKVEAYHMEWPRKVLPALAELGVSVDMVDTVILTHLHWDHCGAATRISESGQVHPTFPCARYYVQKSEYEAAIEKAPVDPDSYLVEDFAPLLQAGVVDFVDGDAEILPGIRVRWTGGHSTGHQIVVIGNEGAPQAVFLSDLIPTNHHLSLDYVMSYDENVEELRTAKQKIIAEAIEKKYLLIFVHAARVRAGYIRQREGNGIEFSQVEV